MEAKYDFERKFREQVLKCSRCGFCQAHCPLFGATLRPAYNARGKMLILKEVMDGKIELNGVGFDATHIVHLPSSGVLPLYYVAPPTTERDIDIGSDRTFTVRTIDGTVHMYRVFAVALWAGAVTGRSGHYWLALWRGEQMYYYNYSTPIDAGPMLQKIERFERPPVDLGMTAEEEVRKHGVLYLSQRVG